MRMLLSTALAAQLALVAGCADAPVAPHDPTSGPNARALSPSVSDGAHGGNEHVFFLPPIVAEPEFSGTFDPSRSPTVQICEIDGSGCAATIAEFTLETGPGSETVRVDTVAENYGVNWHTNEFDLIEGSIYRIRILVEGQGVAHADVEPVSSGKEMKNSESGDTFPLKDGKTLPIKFRIEEGLDVSDQVPAVTPDGVPSSVFNPENLTSRGFYRNLIGVLFTAEASQEARQTAIDRIEGTVVGGVRAFDDDGVYHVRIQDDGTVEPLFAAIAILKSLPQVRHAGPIIAGNFDGIFDPDRAPTVEICELTETGCDPVIAAFTQDAGSGSETVPAVAPDTVPEGFYDEGNFRMGSACVTGRMLRGIVVVMFEEGTTQQEKQKAVDTIDGEVVGGIRSRDDIEGYYYVQVENDPEGRILCDAVETLNALPQVANATESLTVSSLHRRPDKHSRQPF